MLKLRRSSLRSTVIILLIGAIGATLALHSRARWLASIDFRISSPPVPVELIQKIKDAEARSYAARSKLRQLLEYGQDALTFVAPGITYRLNFSLGPYHIKAKTIQELLPWAVENEYLTILDAPRSHALESIAYFAEQPGLADWGASLIVQSLKERHPQLKTMSWNSIVASDQLVAKIYSGYMGAGGDWDLWEENLKPGPIALQRLNQN